MALSKMMEHYLKIKEKYPDCMVFYRLGDFYEMFFDDAKKGSELLDLTLTGRDCGLPERAPMCGIPYHAADVYIQKLVSMGEKVAICEQLTEPTKGALVQRDIVRIATAGTIIEDGLIDDKSNNFLCSVYLAKDKCGLAWADITTGDFYAKSFTENVMTSLTDDLVKIAPAEIICNQYAYDFGKELPLVKHNVLPRFSAFDEYAFSMSKAEEELKTQFGVKTLEPYNIAGDEAAICAAGAIIRYLKETQRHALNNITGITCESKKNYMVLDVNAVKNLELIKTLKDGKRYGSLLWLLDKTSTGMGARTLQNWILFPLKNKDDINERSEAVEQLYKSALLRNGLTELLKSVKDLSRLTGKISNGNLTPRDCVALCSTLEVLPTLKFRLSGISSKFIQKIYDKIFDFKDIAELLEKSIDPDAPALTKDGGYIKKGYNKELDEYRMLSTNAQELINGIEAREREATGIKTLRIRYNRVFGYYIEVTNSFKDLVPYNYQRRQTIANAERYVTEELKDLEDKILSANEKSLKLESELYTYVKSRLSEKIADFIATAKAIGELDVINSFATVSKENNYTRPVIADEDGSLEISGGRHPVVEAISKERFVPNDTSMDEADNRMLIITGPNMAGKSTYMRQTALITLMAHIGCFVPANKATIPLTDKIFTRIGASDNLILDQSTFMVEMTEVASILKNATKNSLIILDEIGRGTSTYDGLSIAWSVVEYITKNIKAKTMFATHYHELSELEGKLEGVKNYKVTVKELGGTVVFLRKIVRGGANRSFGIEVAELAGVDKNVTLRAKEILKELEKKGLSKKVESGADKTGDSEKQLSEAERIIKDLDINKITPLMAFEILSDLKEKVN